jgi:hypothetical protein
VRSKQKASAPRQSGRPYLDNTFDTGVPATSHTEQLLAGRIRRWSSVKRDGYRKPGSLHGQTRKIKPWAPGERKRPNGPGTYKRGDK